ncbi:TonB-dependent receptor domain-containing protein [Pontibacter silvestris]|uniref:TonB-dependent receptor domain-containing protein n=1 Tax=Pontibacter silvestris TaxID=2305183 RepID=A0ABW4WSA1_9BACT|nr:outer membrane beta-barrel family protein [Pontibacter silvestris]MCC9137820.1 TonB-dependent receptor [Pontibacter silvestris]
MNKHLLLLLLGLSTTPVFAQAPADTRPQAAAIPGTTAPRGNARISGNVIDTETQKPVEFATVALINLSTGKPVDGTMVDDKGCFTLSKVAAGKYKINVSFLGYQQQVIDNITISSDNADVNIGTIALASDAKKLEEVVITGEKPLVEEKIDRTVYNAEKDITNAGGNAADVLQKVPALSLDNDGNVQLRGSSNVRILINNKPSSIMAGSVADALKQIPADMIKSVEVITSPSAKYDAEGTAGIINIITKKEGLQGVNGSVSLTAGNRSSNGNASLNIRRGKFGVNGNFGSNMFYNKGNMTNTILAPANNSISVQGGNTEIDGSFMNGQLGFDYEITQKNSLSGGVRLNGGTFKMQNDQDVYATIEGNVSEDFKNEIRNRNQRTGTDYNLDFTHTFKNPGQELAILSLYSVTDTENKINQDFFNEGDAPYQLKRNVNDGSNKELTFQVDYTHPFKNKTTLEVGAKNIIRDVESNAVYNDVFENGTTNSRTDNFFYEQDVYASYLTYGFMLKKKLNVKFGGRYEYTDINADLEEDNSDYTTNYDNFIPSIAFSYTLKDKHTFKANFTQRIQRPSLFYLNPYRQEQTSNTFVEGNPNLDAELTNLYELGYSTFFKTTSISASLYMRQTDNAIEPIATIEEVAGRDVTILSYQNIAKNKTYGVSLFGSTKPLNNWTIGGSSNIYYVDLNSAYNKNSGWMYNINLNSSYILGKGISAQFNGGFNSRRIQLLGEFASFSYHSIAFKKELFDKKGGISLGFDNPFRENMRMKNDLYSKATPTNPRAYEQHIRINNFNRGMKVTFNYTFGKLEQARPRRKKSIRNDDAKQGDGNGVG